MKNFSQFLNESAIDDKGNIIPKKGEAKKTIKSLNNLIKKDGVQTKLNLGNTSTTNLPGGGEKVNRGAGRPVGSTNRKTNTKNTQTQLNFGKTNNKTPKPQSELEKRMSNAQKKNVDLIKNKRGLETPKTEEKTQATA
tara:strand:+ start:166 stop:579 length:414 start_codon:yes stop_codon:yes gene_type:complete